MLGLPLSTELVATGVSSGSTVTVAWQTIQIYVVSSIRCMLRRPSVMRSSHGYGPTRVCVDRTPRATTARQPGLKERCASLPAGADHACISCHPLLIGATWH